MKKNLQTIDNLALGCPHSVEAHAHRRQMCVKEIMRNVIE
jgi:hypothetical protein